MKFKSLLLLASLTCASSAAGQAQFFDLSSETFDIADITPDGQTIVGIAQTGGCYIWNWQTAPSPTLLGGNFATGISDDGTVVAGNIDDPMTGENVAAIWTQANGWVPLGGLAGSCSGTITTASDISGDGSTVVGLAYIGCGARGFRWTQATGMQELQNLVNGTNRSSAISADGSLVVGFAQGNFSRTPATWLPDTTGQAYDPDVVGECRGVSSDGGLVVGNWDQEAFYHDGTTLTQFGSLFSGWIGAGTDVTVAGDRICGFDFLGLGKEAWVWSESAGIERLSTKLQNLGVPGVPDSLGQCRKMSANGGVIAGQTSFVGGWIAVLPPEVEIYCVAKPTSNGCLPEIGFLGGPASATGLQPFDVTASEITGQRPGLMFFGFNAAAIPFNGGTLCVQPPLARTSVQFSNGTPFTCTGSYTYDFQGLIQGGTNPFLTVGSDVFAQYWFRDPPDAFGVGLTNAITFQILP